MGSGEFIADGNIKGKPQKMTRGSSRGPAGEVTVGGLALPRRVFLMT
jgi:hypothetical protein